MQGTAAEAVVCYCERRMWGKSGRKVGSVMSFVRVHIPGLYALRGQRKALLQGSLALLIASLGNLVAGLTLGSITGTLEALPGFMVLIPAAIGMRGNIYGALGSRLGTYLHTGLLEPGMARGSALDQNVRATTGLSLVISAVLAFYAFWFSRLFGIEGLSIFDFFLISVLAGTLSGLVVMAFTVFLSAACRAKGWDMDNVAAPIVTAAGDVVTIPSLFLASFLLGMKVVFWVSVVVLAILCVIALVQGLSTREQIFRQVFRQSLPVLGIAGLVDVVAGLTLESRLEDFIVTPALLVMVPPFLADAGALGGMLTARLSSRLHLGTVSPRAMPGSEVKADIVLTYTFAIFIFFLVGVTAELAAVWTGLAGIGLLRMVALSLIAGVLATTASILAAYYAAMGTFRFGLDPDSLGIPVVTSTLDLFGVLSLLAAIFILGIG